MYKIIKNIEKNFSLKNSRLERKIKVNKNQINLFKSYFQGIGFFKKYPDKIINSIYFDDKNLNFARSNINGEFYRIKPRVRWYDNLFDKINHEFKIKIGFNGYKSTIYNIFSEEKKFDRKLNLIKEFYQKKFNMDLTEVLTVKYERSYLEHPSGVRLTLDKNISSQMINKNSYFLMPYEVIEFKYNKTIDNFFRSNIFGKLKNLPLRMTKCSKYVECLLRQI